MLEYAEDRVYSFIKGREGAPTERPQQEHAETSARDTLPLALSRVGAVGTCVPKRQAHQTRHVNVIMLQGLGVPRLLGGKE